MRVHSLTILHYGVDYLSYALRSVYHSVDQLHIFYTSTPSHGHRTKTPPIETGDQLVQAAFAYDPDKKIRWYEMKGVTNEGPQRDKALQVVQQAGAELVVVVDCDEVWEKQQLDNLIKFVREANSNRIHCVNMIHFWRSFNWVCRDNGWPARIIDLRQQPGDDAYTNRDIAQVHHFGYAVRDAVLRYKMQIHGHKNEFRHDWLDTIWPVWPPVDNNHPTNGRNEAGEAFWTPEPFDKTRLPEFMRSHPFYNLEEIE